jgi:signal transduction histidine kinase
VAIFINKNMRVHLIDEKIDALSALVQLMAGSAEEKAGLDSLLLEFNIWAEIVSGLSKDYRLSLIDDKGVLLGDSMTSALESGRTDYREVRPEAAAAVKNKLAHIQRYSATAGREYLYVAARISLKSQDAPLVIRAGAPLRVVTEAKNEMMRICFFSVVPGFLLIVIICWLLLTPLENDLKRLIGMAQAMAGGDLSQRLVRHPKNELAKLSLALNRLASRFSRQIRKDEATASRLSSILETMDEGVMVTDESGRISNSNQSLMRMFGLDKLPDGLFPGEAIREHNLLEGFEKVTSGQIVEPIQLHMPGPPEKFIDIKLSPLGIAPHHMGVAAVAHDLTSRRRLTKLRRDFVAGLTREMRAPLENVTLVAEELTKKTNTYSDLKDLTDKLVQGCQRLNELTRGLMELARLESISPRQLRREKINTAELFASVIKVALGQDRSDEETARFQTKIDPDAAVVYGDYALLYEALRNLTDNAMAYGYPGTPIVLRASRSGKADDVILSVSDQGPGVPPAEKNHVFERFYRGARSFAGGRRRTYGMGLALVKHTALAHGGTAELVSPPEGGAVFEIKLPDQP